MAGTEIPGDGERGRLYLMLHCHHHKDFCNKMGSDESHFNVWLIVRGNVTRVSHLFKGMKNWSRESHRRRTPNALPLGQTSPPTILTQAALNSVNRCLCINCGARQLRSSSRQLQTLRVVHSWGHHLWTIEMQIFSIPQRLSLFTPCVTLRHSSKPFRQIS